MDANEGLHILGEGEKLEWLYSLDPQSSEQPRAVKNLESFAVFILAPLAAVGITLNVITLWVWSAEPGFHPTTYLFKVLAMSDILHMIFWFPYQTTKYFRNASVPFCVLSYGNRQFGVYITLLLAVVRVILVFCPLKADHLLSRFRINVVLASLKAICFAIRTFEKTKPRIHGATTYTLLGDVVKKTFGYFAPTSLQIILMMAVIWRVWHLTKVTPRAPSVPPDPSEKASTRQFVYIVLAICATSFISYPVAQSALLIFRGNKSTEQYARIASFTSTFLIMINSSINFFFYLSIAKFRSTLLCKVRRHLLPSVSSSPWTQTTLPTGQTFTNNPADVAFREGTNTFATGSLMPACSFETKVSENKTQTKKSVFDDNTFIT